MKEKVLATQSVHCDAFSSEKEPVLHGMQAAMLDTPVLAEAVPAGHFWQTCEPSGDVSEYVPVGHSCALRKMSTVWLIPEI